METEVLITLWQVLRRQKKRRNLDLAQQVSVSRSTLFWKHLKRSQRNELTTILQSISDASLSSRMIWVKPRAQNGWQFMEAQGDADFREDFRLSKRAFSICCDVLRPYLHRSDTRLRKAIPVEIRIAIAIYALGSVAEYRQIGKPFGVPRCTVCVLLHEFCRAVVESGLCKRLLVFPRGQKLADVVKGFDEKWDFPQCAGAIDGTHIPISPPAERARDYYNRKGWPSIIVQATCDHEHKFTSINAGWPGSVHDARVFTNSEVCRLGNQRRLLPDTRRQINDTQVPLVILGDAAYPLQSWLITPFRDNGNLTRTDTTFNYRHSRARMVIKGAFGRLKGRFRRLLKRTEITLEKMPYVIKTCVVLHNLCLAHGDLLQDDNPWILDAHRYEIEHQQQQPPADAPNYPIVEGRDIRECLKNYFIHQDVAV